MATEENGTNKEVESVEMTTTTDNDQTKIVEQPDHEIDLVPLEGKHWALTLIIDFCVIAAMGVRDYFNPNTRWNIVIGHYYSWIPITDTFVLWVDPDRRGWWLPFRVLTGVQYGVFNVLFIIFGEEKILSPWLPVTILRFALGLLYIGHSLYLLKRYGPKVKDVQALAQYLVDAPIQPLPFLVFSFVALFAGNVFWKMHWNYGYSWLDGPLTGVQSAGSIHFLKSAILGVLINDRFKRGCAHLSMAMLFIIQWFFIFECFSKAPIPYAHALAEGTFVSWALFLMWAARCKPNNLENNRNIRFQPLNYII
eukprot:40023_1